MGAKSFFASCLVGSSVERIGLAMVGFVDQSVDFVLLVEAFGEGVGAGLECEAFHPRL